MQQRRYGEPPRELEDGDQDDSRWDFLYELDLKGLRTRKMERIWPSSEFAAAAGFLGSGTIAMEGPSCGSAGPSGPLQASFPYPTVMKVLLAEEHRDVVRAKGLGLGCSVRSLSSQGLGVYNLQVV